MKKEIQLILFLVVATANTISAQWTNLITDPTGDAYDPSLMDGNLLDYQYDVAADSLWFRFTAASINSTQSTNVGVNLMVNFGVNAPGESLFNFWGNDNAVAWHRLLTVWVTGTAPSTYSGTMGISGGSSVGSSNYTGIVSGLTIRVNPSNNTIIVGMRRADLVPDNQLGNDITVAGAIGSSQFWNDDLYVDPNVGTPPTINLSLATSVEKLEATSPNITLFPNPADQTISIDMASEELITSVIICDVTGKEVLSEVVTINKVDVSTLSQGVYFIKVFNKALLVGATKLVKK